MPPRPRRRDARSTRQRYYREAEAESDCDDETRRYSPCVNLAQIFDTDELVIKCKGCNRFFAMCCRHYDPSLGPDDQVGPTCHHQRIVFTDGACTNNGHDGATSGIGIVIGGEDDEMFQYQWSFPIDDTLDPDGRRTNQRAELLAALEGLKMICDFDEECLADSKQTRKHGFEQANIIVTTDSEYVVKGMTEWVPAWKARGWRKSDGSRPCNLDLFQRLEEEVEIRERRHSCKVKFWYVERRYNHLADAMAKRGARDAVVSVPL
ncbi:ribonuclease H-like domain-containing protein [Phlebopus sp. FC_14]|nr:ribonuclease H-like domain-containing protein [Phlebopus sp. FC_14]